MTGFVLIAAALLLIALAWLMPTLLRRHETSEGRVCAHIADSNSGDGQRTGAGLASERDC